MKTLLAVAGFILLKNYYINCDFLFNLKSMFCHSENMNNDFLTYLFKM